MSENILRQGLTRYLSPARLEALRTARVGVAGAGGLGSNAVLMLARSGVEHFLLIDDDVVDASNLNRQQFWPRHLGRPKVEVLAELVRELNPDARVETCRLRIDAANVDGLVARCPLWLEALDGAADKRLLVERAMLSGRRIASASKTRAGQSGAGGRLRDRHPRISAPGPARDRGRGPAGRRHAGIHPHRRGIGLFWGGSFP